MHYKDFLDILNTIKEGEVFYFKPIKPWLINAFEPSMRDKLFQITIGPDGWYRLRYLLLIEEIRIKKEKLDQMFLDQNWLDYAPFNLVDDYNLWIEKEGNKHFG